MVTNFESFNIVNAKKKERKKGNSINDEIWFKKSGSFEADRRTTKDGTQDFEICRSVELLLSFSILFWLCWRRACGLHALLGYELEP